MTLDHEAAALEELRQLGLREAEAWLERLGATEELGVEVEPGLCDDGCGREGRRFTVGRFSCCRFCARMRRRAGAKVAADVRGLPSQEEAAA